MTFSDNKSDSKFPAVKGVSDPINKDIVEAEVVGEIIEKEEEGGKDEIANNGNLSLSPAAAKAVTQGVPDGPAETAVTLLVVLTLTNC